MWSPIYVKGLNSVFIAISKFSPTNFKDFTEMGASTLDDRPIYDFGFSNFNRQQVLSAFYKETRTGSWHTMLAQQFWY